MLVYKEALADTGKIVAVMLIMCKQSLEFKKKLISATYAGVFGWQLIIKGLRRQNFDHYFKTRQFITKKDCIIFISICPVIKTETMKWAILLVNII